MDFVILYASSFLLYQTLQTLEQERAISRFKQAMSDLRLAWRQQSNFLEQVKV